MKATNMPMREACTPISEAATGASTVGTSIDMAVSDWTAIVIAIVDTNSQMLAGRRKTNCRCRKSGIVRGECDRRCECRNPRPRSQR